MLTDFKIANKIKFKNSGVTDPFLFVRENNFAHWQLLRLLAEGETPAARALPTSLSFWIRPELRGLVVGDPHLMNIEARPFGLLEPGMVRIEIHFNDMDDSGQGPLVGDLLRLLSTSLVDGIDISEHAKKYVRGLRGDANKSPAVVAKLLELSSEKFMKQQKALFKKTVERLGAAMANADGEFNYNGGAGHVRPVLDPAVRVHLEGLLGVSSMADLGIPGVYVYTKTNGGSALTDRYWLLADNKLIEFKKLQAVPGVAGFDSSQRKGAYGRYQFAFAREYGFRRFNTVIAMPSINQVPYMLRMKMFNPLKEAISDGMKDRQRQDVSEYAAFMLGAWHFRSPLGEDDFLLALIEQHREEFAEVMLRTAQQIRAIMELGLARTLKSQGSAK